jgi:hypothetical protein
MKYLICLILLTSCFKEERPTYTRGEFLKMAKEGEPELHVITPGSISEALVSCSDYTPACRYGYQVIVRKVRMIVLFYENPADAIVAAKRIRGYYSRNWVLDEVRGEPVLERYAIKHLNAKKAF